MNREDSWNWSGYTFEREKEPTFCRMKRVVFGIASGVYNLIDCAFSEIVVQRRSKTSEMIRSNKLEQKADN